MEIRTPQTEWLKTPGKTGWVARFRRRIRKASPIGTWPIGFNEPFFPAGYDRRAYAPERSI